MRVSWHRRLVASLGATLVVASCGARSELDVEAGADGGAETRSFPVGTYTRCAAGVHSEGDIFMNAFGFEPGATLTVEARGSSLVVTHSGTGWATQALQFAQATPSAATLAPTAQIIDGFEADCVIGVGVNRFYPASMEVSAGTMAADEGAIFVTLEGELRSDAGSCGAHAAPATRFIVCDERSEGPVAPVSDGPAPGSAFAPGTYACTTQLAFHEHAGDADAYVSFGAAGTLSLSGDGGALTARYDGDPSIAGTLGFLTTSPTTARLGADREVLAPCPPSGLVPRSGTPERLPIGAASLTGVGRAIFVSIAATMPEGGSCAGAQLAGSLICTR